MDMMGLLCYLLGLGEIKHTILVEAKKFKDYFILLGSILDNKGGGYVSLCWVA